jgi:hypothetical protein
VLLGNILLIGYLDVNWDNSIIFGLLKEGFYNEIVIFSEHCEKRDFLFSGTNYMLVILIHS